MIDRRGVLAAAVAGAGLAACASETIAPISSAEAPLSPETERALLSSFAVNLESWYLDVPFLDRFDRAARDGFDHVEFWGVDGEGRGADVLAEMARNAGVNIVQIVGGAPRLAQDGVRQTWLDMCAKTAEWCDVLDTDIATIVGHNDVDGVSKADSLDRYQDQLSAAAPIFEQAQVFAAVEPFNPYNHPGHFVYGSSDALRVVRDVGSPFVGLNWDLFHMQRAEGELIENLKLGADHIVYVQLADAPDRHQPGTGEVNWVNVVRQVRAGGYDKPIGLELWAKDADYERAREDVLALARSL